MKTNKTLTYVASGGLLLGLAVPVIHTLAQEPKVQSKSKVEIQIDNDGGSAQLDIKQMEESLRKMVEGLPLDQEQKAEFDSAIQELRKSMKSGEPGPKKFEWKWESDGSTPNADGSKKEDQPKSNNSDGLPPQHRELMERAQQFSERLRQGNRNLQELMEDFNNLQGLDPNKLMEEMMQQMGGGPGARQFGFRLNPDGSLEPFGDFQRPGMSPRRSPEARQDRGKFSRKTLAEYRPAVKEARLSTVSVLRDGRQAALGIVVTSDGYAITKASEVGRDELECEFHDGSIVKAKVVDVSKAHDLALLKLDAKGLKPVVWSDATMPVGTQLAAAGIDEDPISIGTVSVGERNLDDHKKGYLGVAATGNDKGVIAGEVMPDSPAANAGVKKGDAIISVDGKDVKTANDLIEAISGKKPGEFARLKIEHDGVVKELEIKLGNRGESIPFNDLNDRLDQTARMGAEISRNRADFPNAVQNDLAVNANECGGPVVDIEGRVLGINIARAGRTNSYMIPVAALKELLAKVSEGKLVQPAAEKELAQSKPAEKKADVNALELQLRKAREQLQAAEEALEKARQK